MGRSGRVVAGCLRSSAGAGGAESSVKLSDVPPAEADLRLAASGSLFTVPALRTGISFVPGRSGVGFEVEPVVGTVCFCARLSAALIGRPLTVPRTLLSAATACPQVRGADPVARALSQVTSSKELFCQAGISSVRVSHDSSVIRPRHLNSPVSLTRNRKASPDPLLPPPFKATAIVLTPGWRSLETSVFASPSTCSSQSERSTSRPLRKILSWSFESTSNSPRSGLMIVNFFRKKQDPVVDSPGLFSGDQMVGTSCWAKASRVAELSSITSKAPSQT